LMAYFDKETDVYCVTLQPKVDSVVTAKIS
jgi:hypothetical protein